MTFNSFVYDESDKYEKWEDEFISPPFDKTNTLLPNTGKGDWCAFVGDGESDMCITIGDQFADNMKAHIKAFHDKYEGVMKDMREFGLEFEVVYVIQQYYM